MALAAVQTAMNLEGKSLHPFFSKPAKSQAPEQTPVTADTLIDDSHETVGSAPNLPSGTTKKKRARKSGSVKSTSSTKSQPSLEQFTRPPRTHDNGDTASNGEGPQTSSLEEDPNAHRRKRQKTDSPAPANSHDVEKQADLRQTSDTQQPQHDTIAAQDIEGSKVGEVVVSTSNVQEEQPWSEVDASAQSRARPVASHPKVVINCSTPVPTQQKPVISKKQLKVTKSGKLLSSPPVTDSEQAGPSKKRRSRKSTKPQTLPTVTVIRYGSDDASRASFGAKIEAILSSKKASKGRPTKAKDSVLKAPIAPKVNHPFFTGKPPPQKEKVPEQRPPTPRKSAVTPGKLRSEARRERSPEPGPAFGLSSSTTRSKNSGLNEASWPTKENTHVRNLNDTDARPDLAHNALSTLALRLRKMKNNVIELSRTEELITRLAEDLHQDILCTDNMSESNFKPPEDVRLPTRLLTTGVDIQRKVRNELQARIPDVGEESQGFVHPAVLTLFKDIENTLTPFDEGKCENQPWTHKYSPKSSSHVLQTGNEPSVLKDWLQSLTVLAVGGALKSSATMDVKKPPRKKRKKAEDDFIVSDDEDEEDMVECSDIDGTRSSHLRSLKQPQWTRRKNVILLSGPHGCGKSATVYAVAKELGFEVFEINPGMRRSGKDVQDKVGDMTANHLVNHKRAVASAKEDSGTADDTDNERMNEALQDDLKSGRQGTMTSFFQTKPSMKSEPVVKAKKHGSKVQELKAQEKKPSSSSAQSMLSGMLAPTRSQKQSLILFEEADILFQEDQQFWAQVIKLAMSSKRPIVITCNDETQIPVLDLPLSAILRLQPTPVDLAADYLLALAGREGHILQRKAVTDLYRSKSCDLRASISELNFWCQMSVGDRKGGLEWMYQRWPPGKDVDEHGRLLRVASSGTYQSGMGWLSHNILESKNNVAFDKEEELLKDMWVEWQINPSDGVALEPARHSPLKSLEPNGVERLRTLERLDSFAESLSAVDVYCRVGLPTYDNDYDQAMDQSLPDMTEKARLSYTLAAPLLHVEEQADFQNMDTSIFSYSQLLSQRLFPDLSHRVQPTAQPVLDHAAAILLSQEAHRQPKGLSRDNFAAAFDVLAAPHDYTTQERTSYTLTASSFDRTFRIITLDLAPYVRSIVAHEQVLEQERLRMSNLLSVGGTGKRARTTRAARTALEGGVRETKRRQRWFEADVNFELVMQTAGLEWAGLGWMSGMLEVDMDEERSLAASATASATVSATGSATGSVMGTGDKALSVESFKGSQED
ncbi:hypothetical protein IQ07DRAFT_683216 [Pyrenochaeta sp. DS3sAY3a]|nr:hypothetical protein IQ07DRAFT_683216 [Pyrenochaeta sp. DS3sAY3a]